MIVTIQPVRFRRYRLGGTYTSSSRFPGRSLRGERFTIAKPSLYAGRRARSANKRTRISMTAGITTAATAVLSGDADVAAIVVSDCGN